MKKFLAILGGVILLFLLALILVPVLFKSDILRLIERESSKYIKAELTIGDVNLNMFKSFPDLYVGIKDVTVTGVEEFTGDTLINVPLLSASVNLKSLISGNEIIVNHVLLKDAMATAKVLESGKVNWDILIEDPDEVADKTEEKVAPEQESDKPEQSIQLKDISVKNLAVEYNDRESSLFARINSVDLKLSGNFSESNTLLHIALDLKKIMVSQAGSVWINNFDLHWVAEVAANLKDMIFELKENSLALNDLKLDLTGGVEMQPEKIKMDLKLHAPDTRFETLLAMVPKDFQQYLEGLTATGEFNLAATINGEMYENHLPAFNLLFKINNGHVQYTDLPEAIKKIDVDFQVNNPGGKVESTIVNLKQLGFEVAGNPFKMSLKVSELQDMLLDIAASGVIDFASLKKAMPLDVTELQGVVNMDVKVNGRYSYIEKEDYERFNARGSVVLKNFLFASSDFPQGVSVPEGNLNVSPSQLNLNNLKVKIKSSDFTLNGNVSNYIPYFLKNHTLKGQFALSSNLINLNEFITIDSTFFAETETANAEVEPDEPMAVIAIPGNLDLRLTTTINTILFDNLTIKNVKGNINLANAVANLSNLSMNMFDGTMVMNGAYNTRNPSVPAVDFGLKIADFDIHKAYNSFSFIKQIIPIAMNCEGKISSTMNFAAKLDKEMSPIMTTANGGGFIESKGLLINDNPTLTKLSGVLKNDDLSRLSVSYLKINFKLKNGDIIIEPFKTSIANMPATIYGNQTVDGKMDYTLSMNVDRKYFGKDINNLIKNIPGSDNVKSVDIDVKVQGTMDNPTVKPDLSKVTTALAKEAEKELKRKATEELKNKADEIKEDLKKEAIKGLNKLFK